MIHIHTTMKILTILTTTTILYIIRPQMPLYQISSLQIQTFSLISFLTSLSLSASILAGIQVTNDNYVGTADVYKAYVHIYYPDWHGELHTIGLLRETTSLVELNGDNIDDLSSAADDNYGNAGGNRRNNEKMTKQMEDTNGKCTNYNRDFTKEEELIEIPHTKQSKLRDKDKGICKPSSSTTKINTKTTISTQQQESQPQPKPFFSLQPRTTTISDDGIVTIDIPKVTPKVYLHLLKNSFLPFQKRRKRKQRQKGQPTDTNHNNPEGGKEKTQLSQSSNDIQWGMTNVQVSGAAHVKSTTILGDVPVTIGLLCDNTVNFIKFPLEIVGRTCVLRGVKPGWANIEEFASQMREDTLRRYEERGGNLFDVNEIDEGKMMNTNLSDEFLSSFLVSPDNIANWHDF